ncbi:MAG TPA: HesA/MoeB/ThiF family protein [Candidatus Binataceae bacterium]|nr:HesA/MoeB/ThiF family protein [Candidatus Binataceae bacterium]
MIQGRVLIVGAGGLGVPAAAVMVRAQVASIALVDPDPVELSNLHRQVIYSEADIGRPKVEAAESHLRELGGASEIEPIVGRLDAANADSMVSRFDFVIDATDDPAAKFLINDTCVRLGRSFSYGGVLAMSGQTMTVIPRRTACLRCLFEEAPDANEVASCREAGILGPVAGLIGTVQAEEAIRVLNGARPQFAGSIFSYDGAGSARIRITEVKPRPGCICGAADAAASAHSISR